MPKFKLNSKILGFKSLTGMIAQVFNEDGDLLDSINLNESKSKLKFRFDKDDALQGEKNADLTIKLIDTNGDDINLKAADGSGLDLDSDEQTFTASIKRKKKKGRAKLRPTGSSNEVVDSDAPVFTSSGDSTVSESIDAGTVIYDAEASDASDLSFSLSGSDAGSFSINSATGQVFINASPDASTKAAYNFDVVATDAAGNSSSQAVTLSVTEAVDATPPLISSGSTATVSESITAGTVVYTATATDDSPPVTFALSGSDAGSFSINSATGQVFINASPDASAQAAYNFEVVATDAAGNSSSQAVTLAVTEANTGGDTITLTPFRDVYDANTGTTVNTGVQTPRPERLSTQDETINGIAGTLGTGAQLDSLTDPSTSDNDTLNLATNTASDLQTAIAAGNLTNLTNIENLVVTSIADDSADIDFSQVQELKSLDLNGTFTNNADVVVRNWIDSAGINSFDFSDSSNTTNATFGFDVRLANNNLQQTTEELSFIGSVGNDTFEASVGAATMLGGAGADNLTGSSLNSTYIAGGLGVDTITLNAANAATDTVSFVDIDNTFNRDAVTNFVGFLDTANNPTGDRHDQFEFDAGTVTNLTAGTTVQGKTVAQLQALVGTAAADNHMIVDTAANIAAANFSAHGESWVAYDPVGGDLLYSPDGNFTANSADIGNIALVTADTFLAEQQVTVIA